MKCSPTKKSRIDEIDYLKCIFIVLMVIFHLVYIGDKYPYTKNIVYTFHMSAFLIISGYVANITKEAKGFFNAMLWIFIPYAVMEFGYVIMSSILPVREKVDEITAGLLFHKIIVNPMGPYWYLHTFLICNIIYYGVYRIKDELHPIVRFIIIGICYYICSDILHMMAFDNAMYFLGGIILYQTRTQFLEFFRPTLWALIPFILLCCFPQNLNRATLAGVTITYMAISLSLEAHRYTPVRVRAFCYFIGRNTLLILVFSPLFTITAKLFQPVFSFDPTGLLFTIVAVTYSVGGCIGIGYLSDRLNLSRFFFGKSNCITQ